MIGFEQRLDQNHAAKRSDILDVGIHELNALRAGHAVRPDHVMKILDVTQDEIEKLLDEGILPAPGKWGGGRVAWRADEVEAARDRLADHRD